MWNITITSFQHRLTIPQRNPIPISNHSVSPLPQSQLLTATALSGWICLFWAFYRNGIKQCDILCLAFSPGFMCSRFSHAVTSTSIPFSGWIIVHRVAITYFVYTFIAWRTFGLFLLFGFINTSMSIVYKLFWECMFSVLLDIHLGVKLWILFCIWSFRNCKSVFQTGAPFDIPTSDNREFTFLCIFVNNCDFLSFWSSLSEECEEVYRCGSALYFPSD